VGGCGWVGGWVGVCVRERERDKEERNSYREMREKEAERG